MLHFTFTVTDRSVCADIVLQEPEAFLSKVTVFEAKGAPERIEVRRFSRSVPMPLECSCMFLNVS